MEKAMLREPNNTEMETHYPPSPTPPPVVEVARSERTRTELVQLVMAWLVASGFTSSAQLLHEESTSQLRADYVQRKALRTIERAITERNWEAAQKSARRLCSDDVEAAGGKAASIAPAVPISSSAPTSFTIATLSRSLSFLLYEQQFLELVDEDSGPRAYAFLMRHLKPFELVVGQEHFQKLSYLLTCKTVSEAGRLYPEYRNWTPEAGRARLLMCVRGADNTSQMTEGYCRRINVLGCGDTGVDGRCLERILEQALSYTMVARQYPQLLREVSRTRVSSFFVPLPEQLAPDRPWLAINFDEVLRQTGLVSALGGNPSGDGVTKPRVHLTACEPFFHASAIVLGTSTGAVVWVPVNVHTDKPAPHAAQVATLLLHHTQSIRGMSKHGDQLLLLWGGAQAIVMSVSGLSSTTSGPAEGAAEHVTNVFTHTADTYAGCFFPCGTIVATGLSQGTVTVWDVTCGTKMCESTYSASAVVSLAVNRSGTRYFAASQDGVVRVVDVATGVLVHHIATPFAAEISAIALSPSSALLLTASKGGILRLWDTLTGSPLSYQLAGVENNTRASLSLTFGEHDSFVFCGGEDGTFNFWDLRLAHKPTCAGERRPACAVEAPRRTGRETGPADGSLEGYGRGGEGVARRHVTTILRPTTRLMMHRACVTSLKTEGPYALSCGDDDMIYVYANRCTS